MLSIDEIMQMLDCNNEKRIQQKGLKIAQNVKCLRAFMQPLDKKYNKNVWENCAMVIYNRTDDEISSYLENMFEWLQDINWPGAKIIAGRLSIYKDKEWLNFIKDKCLVKAKSINDKSWIKYINTYEDYIEKV